MMANRVPLWSITTWDKKYSAVEKEWQPQTIKYKYLLSDELDRICVEGGDVRLLYTGKDIGYTTEDLAGDALAEGEIVAIPWGGTPSVKYFKGKFVTGDNRIATSSKPDELLNKYLYYFLLGHLKEISTYYRGAGLKHPAMRDILSMKISYPDLEKQSQIITQIDLLQEIIDKRNRQIVELDNLINARFVELFGDPVSNDHGWNTVPLETVCKTIVDCPHSTPSYTDVNTGYMCIRTSIVKKNRIMWDEIEYIPEHEYKKRIQRKCPEKGDIVYTREGAILGIAAIIDRECNVALGQRSMLLSPDTTRCLPQFLCVAMNFDTFLRKALKGLSGSASPHINVGDIKAFMIIVPPMELQDRFAAFVEQVDKSKVVVQKALDEAQTLFDSLMQEYFG